MGIFSKNLKHGYIKIDVFRKWKYFQYFEKMGIHTMGIFSKNLKHGYIKIDIFLK